jgi:hypothetical protein
MACNCCGEAAGDEYVEITICDEGDVLDGRLSGTVIVCSSCWWWVSSAVFPDDLDDEPEIDDARVEADD